MERKDKVRNFNTNSMKYLLALFVVLITLGCTTDKVTLPNKTEIIHQKLFYWGSANRVEFEFKDPNTTVTLLLESPSSKVSPGKLTVKDPHSGVELGIKAE